MRQRLLQWGRRAADSTFLRRFGVLVTGAAAAQAIPVAAAPLLARLYTPEAFGEYALFVSGVNILSQAVCLKYDFAILTAEGEDEAHALFRLSAVLAGGLSLALFCVLLPFSGPAAALLGARRRGWLLLVPGGSFAAGLFSAMTYREMRDGGFRAITKANGVRAAVVAALQLLLAGSPLLPVGLVLGQTLGYGIACLLLRRKGREHGAAGLRQAASRYRGFPQYTMPGALCGSISAGAASFFLSAFYSTGELGGYSLVNRLLSAPLALVSTSAGQAYAKELAEAKSGGEPGKVLARVAALLAALSLPVFAGAFLLADWLIPLAFGPQWLDAASILRILIPLAAVRFVVAPISSTGVILGRQRSTLIWQACLLAASLLPALAYGVRPMGLKAYLTLQTILLCLCYLVFLFYCRRLTRHMKGERDG